MKLLSILILAITFLSTPVKKDYCFQDATDLLYKKYGGKNDKSTFKLSSNTKRAYIVAIKKDSTGLLRQRFIDTLYVMERRNPENGGLQTSIWNTKSILSYSFLSNKLIWLTQTTFSKYQISLIKDWNIAEIKEEEKLNGHWFDARYVTAYRVYLKKGILTVDEVSFSDFVNVKKDINN